MNKYRLRLDSGRVVGPFNIKDYAELVKKHQLSGLEEYQIYPIGDWKDLDSFPELQRIYEKAQLAPNRDDTFMMNIKDMLGEKKESGSNESTHSDDEEFVAPREFEFAHEDPFEGVSFEPTSSTKIDVSGKNKSEPLLNVEVDSLEDLELDVDTDDDIEAQLERTRVVSGQDLDKSDKTVINNDYQKYLQQKKIAEENEKKKLEEEQRIKTLEEQIEIVEPDYNSDKTEFVNMKELKKGLEQALEIEEDFDKIEKEKRRETNKLKRKNKQEEEPQEEDELDDQLNSGKRKIFLLIFAVAFCLYFFFPEESEKQTLKEIEVLKPSFQFPMRNPVIDKDKAKELFLKGMQAFNSHKHKGYIVASKIFVKSLEYNFDGNDAASRLIFAYSQLLNESTSTGDDTRVVYNLVQYFKKYSYEDPNYAAATANFYLMAGKYNAATNILERYLAIEGHKPTLELYAVYLNVLVKTGDIVKADNAIKALEKQKIKDLFVLKAMYNFYKYQNNLNDQLRLIKDVQSDVKLSKSVFFLLEKAELFLKDGDLKEVRKLLFLTNELNVEGSRVYYAKYLKLMGLYFAAKKDYQQAVSNMQKSMKVFELPELVGDLAIIENTEDSIVNDMIIRSKVKILNQEAEKELSLKNLNNAFKLAIKSSDMLPNNIETRLLLSRIQIAKGYYDDALKQIKELYDQNRDNTKVLYELINLYVDMHKFRNAEEHLQIILDKTTWEYASVRAKLYRIKGDFTLGINWLVKAINLNQLNEENIFALANFYVRFHKYNKAKLALNKVMDLDPLNVNYKITYAKILYEMETAASAIGYLYDVMKDFPENSQILSEIGIYYYRSGQIKNYESIRDKLKLVTKKDTTLYRFLIESAKLDDDFEKVVEYSNKVVEIEPGDLETRIYLAEVLLGLRRFKESKEQLDEIKKRFESYPRLNYFYAKFYLLINEIDKAIELANLERSQNPAVVDGALLLGDIYKKKNEIIKAREYYLMASQIDPKSVDAVIGLAYVAFHTNQYDLALDQYQKAIELDELRAETYMLIGDVYRKLGRTQQAIKNYKHFLELSPNSSYKNNLMDYIQKVE